MSWTLYKHGIKLSDEIPSGDAGLQLYDNLKAIADYLDGLALISGQSFAGDITISGNLIANPILIGTSGEITYSTNFAGSLAIGLGGGIGSFTYFGTGTINTDCSIETTSTVTASSFIGSYSGTILESQVTNLSSDLTAKAPIASPTFTGTATAPTYTATSSIITDTFTVRTVTQISSSPIKLDYIKYNQTSLSTTCGTSITLVASQLKGIVHITSTASFTLNLPTPSTVITFTLFKIKNASGNTMTVSPGSANLDGSTSTKTITGYGILTLYTDGTSWFTA